MHPINAKGLALIRDFEGFSAVAYLCPAGVWTIGYGFTQGVKEGDTITREAADARLAYEVDAFATGVANLISRPANENELAAMTSLAFNIGLAAFGRSTVLRAHNRGDTDAAARAFGLWNKAGGKVLRGLTRRRSAEAALYLEPVRLEIPLQKLSREAIEPEEAMPQRIDAERSLFRSEIVRGGSAAGGVAGLTLAAEGARAVSDIRSSLGDMLPYIALGIILAVSVYIIYERVKQRRGGWA
jgi:lysozyme